MADVPGRVERWYKSGKITLTAAVIGLFSLMLGLWRCSQDHVREPHLVTSPAGPGVPDAPKPEAQSSKPSGGHSSPKKTKERRDEVAPSIEQTMTNSPSGIQAGGNVTINSSAQP